MTGSARKLDDLVEAARRQMPDLQIRRISKGLDLRWEGGRYVLPAEHVRTGTRRRTEKGGRSYVDLESGTLHLHAPGLFVHLRVPVRRHSLTAGQCGLLAIMCEAATSGGLERLPPNSTLVARYIEARCGQLPTAMTISRFLRLLEQTGIVDADGRFDSSKALDRIREDFSIGRIGTVRRFRIAAEVGGDAVVRDLFPFGIHGISHALEQAGIYKGEPDVIVTVEAIPLIRQKLGPPARRDDRARALEVRTSHRAPLAFLSGERDRDFLHPILAAAAVLKIGGPVREAGEKLWKAARRAK